MATIISKVPKVGTPQYNDDLAEHFFATPQRDHSDVMGRLLGDIYTGILIKPDLIKQACDKLVQPKLTELIEQTRNQLRITPPASGDVQAEIEAQLPTLTKLARQQIAQIQYNAYRALPIDITADNQELLSDQIKTISEAGHRAQMCNLMLTGLLHLNDSHYNIAIVNSVSDLKSKDAQLVVDARYATLSGVELKQSTVMTSTFAGAKFNDFEMVGGNLIKCDLSHAQAIKTAFNGVTFNYVNAEGVGFNNSIGGLHEAPCIFRNCQFNHCDFTNAVFKNCVFLNCVFNQSRVDNATFEGCQFLQRLEAVDATDTRLREQLVNRPLDGMTHADTATFINSKIDEEILGEVAIKIHQSSPKPAPLAIEDQRIDRSPTPRITPPKRAAHGVKEDLNPRDPAARETAIQEGVEAGQVVRLADRKKSAATGPGDGTGNKR